MSEQSVKVLLKDVNDLVGKLLVMHSSPDGGCLPNQEPYDCPDCGKRLRVITGLDADSYFSVLVGVGIRFRLRMYCDVCKANHGYRMMVSTANGITHEEYLKERERKMEVTPESQQARTEQGETNPVEPVAGGVSNPARREKDSMG